MLARPVLPERPSKSRRQTGFTLVELVVVMTLMTVITAVGMARFADREPFAVQGLADQLVSGLRVAQATAIAQRRTVYVNLSAAPPALAVCLDAACTQPLTAPGGDSAWLDEAQGLHLNTAAIFSFGADGTPSFGTLLQLQVLSDGGAAASQLIDMEAGSGYVHPH